MVAQYMINRSFFGLERQMPRDGKEQRCRLLASFRFVLDHHDVALWFFKQEMCDLEKLIGADG